MTSEDLIWHNTVDNGTYAITVTRTGPYSARLLVVRGETEVLDRMVPLTYGAPFGPDVDDVAHWQEIILSAIDKDYRTRGEAPPA